MPDAFAALMGLSVWSLIGGMIVRLCDDVKREMRMFQEIYRSQSQLAAWPQECKAISDDVVFTQSCRNALVRRRVRLGDFEMNVNECNDRAASKWLIRLDTLLLSCFQW